MSSQHQILPVDPALGRENGKAWLLALEPLLGRDGSAPVAQPPVDGAWDFEFEAHSLATSVSIDLGVSAVFKGSTAVNSTTLIWNALVGKRAVLDDPTPTSVIYETFWGIGLRVAITFVSTDIKTDTDVAMVAASAEFKSSDVQYEIHAIGLGAKDLATVLKTLPPLGRFDLDTFSLLEDVRSKLKDTLLSHLHASGDAASLLRPVQVAISASPFHDTVDEAAAYHVVMVCLANGLDLSRTRQERAARWATVDASRVDAAYRAVAGGDGPPTSDVKKRAAAWLDLR